MSVERKTHHPVLMRSSLTLDDRDPLFGLVTMDHRAETQGGRIQLRIYPTDHPTRKTRIVVCEAQGTWPALSDVVGVLRGISRGEFPSSANRKLHDKIAKSKSSRLTMSMQEMPSGFRTFCDAAARTLVDRVTSFVGLLRWRVGVLSSFPLWARGHEFSLDDGTAWHWLPHDLRFEIRVGELLPKALSAAMTDDARLLFARAKEEPVSHQLFREAWSLRSSNPRASLAIGYASLEVGCKELIIDLVPDAAWLAAEVQSPPVDRMLARFIPKLSKKSEFTGKPTIPAGLLKTAREAMEARNKLAHAGSYTWTYEKLDSVLRGIRDLLSMFYVYEGERWAAQHLSHETIRLLRAKDSDDKNIGLTRP